MLTVEADRGSYNVHFLQDSEVWIQTLRSELKSLMPSTIVVCSNQQVFDLYGDYIISGLNIDATIHTWLFPDGEEFKNLETVVCAINGLDSLGLDRRSVLIALGGGVVGDLTGFLASMMLRGLSWIQCPTTLLAMVDSSVGGKTGCNLASGKNRLGAFYSPNAVVTLLNSLETLEQVQMRSGWGECIKHILLGAPEMIPMFENMVEKDLLYCPHQFQEFPSMLETLCSVKSTIVSEDEFESGWRATLNLGHTIGHALEKILGYGTITHGEAVLLGMLCELKWQYVDGVSGTKEMINVIERLINTIDMSIKIDDTIDELTMFDAISFDKKMQCDKLTMIGLDNLGKPLLTSIGPSKQLELCTFSVNELNNRLINKSNQ